MNDAERMSSDRFRELAEAYGGAVARWPEAVREQAMRVAADPRFTAMLADADALDTLLDGWHVSPPSAALVDAVLARIPLHRRSPRSRMRLWWSSIGIATVLAGGVAGAVAVSVIADPERVPVENTTAFGDLAGQDV